MGWVFGEIGERIDVLWTVRTSLGVATYVMAGALVLDGLVMASDAQGRRRLARWFRALVADDEPWSSGFLLVVAALAVALVLLAILRRWSGAGVLFAVALSIGAIWGLAHRFTRRTLRLVTGAVVLLSLVSVVGIGRRQLSDEARERAIHSADRLQAQLDDLNAGVPPYNDLTRNIAKALSDLRIHVAERPADIFTTTLLTRIDDLAAAVVTLSADSSSASAAQTVLDGLQADARRIEGSESATAAFIKEAADLANQVRVALTPGLWAPAYRARGSIDALRDAVKPGKFSARKDLDQAEARARLDTARAVASSSPPDQAAADKAVAAAQDAFLAATEEDPPHASILDVFSAGGRALARAAPGLGGAKSPVVFEIAGWSVLLGLALLAYRQLEGRVGRTELLLNTVQQIPESSDKTTLERFRAFLTRNIPEPSAIPGASSPLAPVTDLLSAAGAAGSTHVTAISSAIKAAIEALKAPRGAAVIFSVLDPATADQPPPGMCLVAVRVSPPGLREEVHRTFSGSSADEAVRVGAYWAAALLIERSRRAPPWAVWNPDACHALATYYAVDDLPGQTPPRAKMIEAVAIAPRSGLLLLALADRYALDGHLVDAFEYCLRAASLYPRWPVASYRLAITAVMLARDDGSELRQADMATLEALCAALDRSRVKRGSYLSTALRDANGTWGRALCDFATDCLQEAEDKLRFRAVWPRMLRCSERSYWFSVLKTRDRTTFRAQFRILAESARAMASARSAPNSSVPVTLTTAVEDAALSWQLAYNLACIHSQRALVPSVGAEQQRVEIAEALALLELAVSRPGGEQLSSDWLKADPDLAPLREEPRFTRLASRLPREDAEQ